MFDPIGNRQIYLTYSIDMILTILCMVCRSYLIIRAYMYFLPMTSSDSSQQLKENIYAV